MPADNSTPADARGSPEPPVPTELVAEPDDVEEPACVLIRHEDATMADLATEWIEVDVRDLVDLQAIR